jgi:hypothetical protein
MQSRFDPGSFLLRALAETEADFSMIVSNGSFNPVRQILIRKENIKKFAIRAVL